MDAAKTGSIVSRVVSMVVLGACSSPSPTRPHEATPESPWRTWGPRLLAVLAIVAAVALLTTAR